MKIKVISILALACLIAVPAFPATAQHKITHGHTASAPKSKMKSLGHGVYVDSKGAYHSKDGKFMSKDKAHKLLGKSTPARDSKGRFVSKKKPSKLSKLKAKLHPKRKH